MASCARAHCMSAFNLQHAVTHVLRRCCAAVHAANCSDFLLNFREAGAQGAEPKYMRVLVCCCARLQQGLPAIA